MPRYNVGLFVLLISIFLLNTTSQADEVPTPDAPAFEAPTLEVIAPTIEFTPTETPTLEPTSTWTPTETPLPPSPTNTEISPTVLPTEALIEAPINSPTEAPLEVQAELLSEMSLNAEPTYDGLPGACYTTSFPLIDTEAELIAAITTANGLNTPSVLCLVPNTEMILTTVSAPNASSGNTFLPVIQKDITIIGNTSWIYGGMYSDALLMGRFARVSGAGAKLTLYSMTVSGFMTGSNHFGAAVRVDSGTFEMEDSSLLANEAWSGGAIYNNLGNVIIHYSTLRDNIAVMDGGAIYNTGTLFVNFTFLDQNAAGERGGAVYTTGSSTFNYTPFNNNVTNSYVSRGGAIYITGSTATLTGTDVDFSYNVTGARGGAIYNDNADVSLTRGSLKYNQATDSGSDGGAIFTINANASVTLQDVAIIGNTALDQGGAIGLSSGTGTITGSCFAGNTASSGGAIYSNQPFTATGNWWEAVPPVNSNVTTTGMLQTCPVAALSPLPLAVTGFSLVHNTTNVPFAAMTNNSVIDLRTYTATDRSNMRIQANVSPATTGSVVFEIDGVVYSTDNTSLYRLPTTWAITTGIHTFKATPYTGPNGTGIMGTPVTVTVEFIG